MIRIDFPQVNIIPTIKKTASEITQQYDDLDADTITNFVDIFDGESANEISDSMRETHGMVKNYFAKLGYDFFKEKFLNNPKQ